MYISDYQIRIRYSETDQMGYVYYGNYAAFYEVGRVEAMRQLGYAYKTMEESGTMMPVLEMHTQFLQPARYDELVTIRTTIPEMPGVRLQFLHDIFGEDGNLINSAVVKLVFVNSTTQKPCRPPARIVELLSPFFK